MHRQPPRLPGPPTRQHRRAARIAGKLTKARPAGARAAPLFCLNEFPKATRRDYIIGIWLTGVYERVNSPLYQRKRSRWNGETQRDAILRYICWLSREQNGIPPTIQEIADEFDLHPSSVQTHLRKLENEGRISWVGNRSHKRIMVEQSEWTQPKDVEL
ncbi:LexA family protein [Aggregatilinea sp.]|uniref:LexA family protein n=1 Tax=Aggregatilinea sp. TaxID=2806333 RepID=UPI003FA5A41F